MAAKVNETDATRLAPTGPGIVRPRIDASATTDDAGDIVAAARGRRGATTANAYRVTDVDRFHRRVRLWRTCSGHYRFERITTIWGPGHVDP